MPFLLHGIRNLFVTSFAILSADIGFSLSVFCSKMQDEMKLFDLSAKNVDSLNLIYADPGNEMADVVLSPSKTTLENLKFMVKAGRGLGDVCEIVGMPRKR